MKKNLLLFAAMAVIIFSCADGHQSADAKFDPYQSAFQKLTPTPLYNNEGDYRYNIDTAANFSASGLVYGELGYRGQLIWHSDSTTDLIFYGTDSLILATERDSKTRIYKASLFYKGRDITSKAHPKNLPQILEYRRSDDRLYICYWDYGCYMWGEDSQYGCYDLKTETLKIFKNT